MRKKLLMTAAVGVIAASTLYHDHAQAASPGTIRSRGSFMFGGDGGVALYSADIVYLKGELDSLFGELPGDSDDEDYM